MPKGMVKRIGAFGAALREIAECQRHSPPAAGFRQRRQRFPALLRFSVFDDGNVFVFQKRYCIDPKGNKYSDQGVDNTVEGERIRDQIKAVGNCDRKENDASDIGCCRFFCEYSNIHQWNEGKCDDQVL